jgi:hypothetical protein
MKTGSIKKFDPTGRTDSRDGVRQAQWQSRSRFKRMLYSISLESEWSRFVLVLLIVVVIWLLNNRFSVSN